MVREVEEEGEEQIWERKGGKGSMVRKVGGGEGDCIVKGV